MVCVHGYGEERGLGSWESWLGQCWWVENEAHRSQDWPRGALSKMGRKAVSVAELRESSDAHHRRRRRPWKRGLW